MTDVGRNTPADQAELLAATYDDLLQRQTELLKAGSRAPKACNDDETAKRLTDFCGQLAACIAAATKAHKVEKEPFLDGGRVVDGFFRAVRQPLEAFKDALEQMLGGYQHRKQEAARQAALEAERLAREEMERLAAAAESEADLENAIAQEDAALDAAMIAAARPLERSRIHGDLATGSLRTTYSYTLIDLTKVPRQFLMLNDSAVKKHIAAAPQDKEPDPIPGLKFTPNYVARIRA